MTTNSGSVPGDVFDVRKVRKFIELMNEHDLAEIDLRQGDQRIRLRRGPEMVTVATTPTAAFASTGAPSVSHGAARETKSGAAAPDDGARLQFQRQLLNDLLGRLHVITGEKHKGDVRPRADDGAGLIDQIIGRVVRFGAVGDNGAKRHGYIVREEGS